MKDYLILVMKMSRKIAKKIGSPLVVVLTNRTRFIGDQSCKGLCLEGRNFIYYQLLKTK